MKRLVAYVRHERNEWLCEVQCVSGAIVQRPDGSLDFESNVSSRTSERTPLAAVEFCEGVARDFGFGLRWHGFVAYGFEIERPSSEPKGTEGGRG